MPLDATLLAKDLDDFQKQFFDSVDENTPKDQFINQMSMIIDKHFQNVQLSGMDVTIASVAGSLGLSNTPDPNMQLADLVQKVVKYWSMAITPGIPTPPNTSVTVVINTASSMSGPLTAQLTELAFRDKKEPIGYKDFATILVNAVKTITWTCTEISPSGAPVTVPVMVVG